MKKKAIILIVALLPLPIVAQQVKIPQSANHFTYWQIEYGEPNDTTVVTIERIGSAFRIVNRPLGGTPVPGYAPQQVSADWLEDSITVSVTYPDSTFYYRSPFSRNDIEWTIDGNTHICHINSNRLEFDIDTTTGYSVTPLPWYGLSHGVLRSFTRNGQRTLVLAKAESVRPHGKQKPMPMVPQGETVRRVTPRQLDRIMKERLVVTTRIFDNVQLHWGEENAHVAVADRLTPSTQLIPRDTVLHFAGGTLVLKRVTLPALPSHYQHFIEVHQRSNGDAYDRTGSIFMLRTSGWALHNFFDGINQHPDSLPTFTGRDGQHYQGIISQTGYDAPLEIMRFFTPFGVGHFNERMSSLGIDWRGEAYYRQEITDLYPAMGNDVIIGAWIGNYDAGGHRLTVDLKSYPNDYTQLDDSTEWQGIVEPLFNTCNVLEMAGQNYGKLFGTDSLTVHFRIPVAAGGKAANSARLRYISTGHGGWGGGDEFVPKPNTILVDGQVAYTYTPWREDCGTYRDLNPVSGNFWNGLSSSDFSRSGWCPGTATQPVYFDLMPWADGHEHTLTVAIPQGQPVEGMFSHWAVSGVLIVEY